MDQSHTRLPNGGVNATWNEAISQHITGVLEHGHGVTIYRSFENIRKGSNLTVYTFLSQLEDWRSRHEGRYPEEIFLQVEQNSFGYARALSV